jgi:single-strand DNA-binding protein
MAKGFNKVTLLGNLTRDPETRNTPSGQSVTNFSLAVNRTWKGSDGQQQEAVSYIDCVAWGKAGEIISQYLTKGRPVLVHGRLDQRSWDDKDSGQKRSKIEVVVEDFNFIDSGSGGSSDSAPRTATSSAATTKKKDDVVIDDVNDQPIDLSEIPF